MTQIVSEWQHDSRTLVWYPKNPGPDSRAITIRVGRGDELTRRIKGRVVARSGRVQL